MLTVSTPALLVAGTFTSDVFIETGGTEGYVSGSVISLAAGRVGKQLNLALGAGTNLSQFHEMSSAPLLRMGHDQGCQ